jgi:hypothetical protein
MRAPAQSPQWRQALAVTGPVALVGLVAGLYLYRLTRPDNAVLDLQQLQPSFTALLHGHIARVYSPNTAMTSPPGFLVLSAPLMAALGDNLGHPVTLQLLALAWTSVLLVSGDRLLTALCPAAGRWRRAVGAGAILTLAPFVSAVRQAYHPEDLAATALLLLALERTARRRGLSAGVCLGLLLVTRQWGVLAVAPVLLANRATWRRTSVAALAVCASFLVPFALVSPQGFHRALTATDVVSLGSWALPAHLPLKPFLRYDLARVAPVGLAAALGLALRRRWRCTQPTAGAVMGATLAAVTLRVVFDTDSLIYYLAPTAATSLVLGLALTGRKRWMLLAIPAAFEAIAAEAAAHPLHTLNAVGLVPWALGIALELACLGAGALGLAHALGTTTKGPRGNSDAVLGATDAAATAAGELSSRSPDPATQTSPVA